MTPAPAGQDAAVTDRALLAGSAYRTGRDLAARQSLYRWQTPRHDLSGIVAGQLREVRGTAVDVGCGNGKFITRLAADRPDLRVLGLDISPGILAGVPGAVAVADATGLPLREACADAALALHMLYHVADIPAAVAELDRILAPGGTVLVSANSIRDKAELDRLWERATGDIHGIPDGPPRISLSARFALEKAPAFLGERFSRIETIALPGTISVTDPAPVVAHLQSYRAWAGQHDVPFAETITRARDILTDHITARGSFDITCLGGILTCTR
jgi:SAM-dependent methyltransferase